MNGLPRLPRGRLPHGRLPRGRCRLALVAGVLALAGCQQPDLGDNPNRVLDRPTDLALTCVQIHCVEDDPFEVDEDGVKVDNGHGEVDADECAPQAVGLELCSQDAGSCTSRPTVYPQDANGEVTEVADGDRHLFGFVANSERNEIAMFAQCADRLIDMNIETPGYNFVPAGVLPTHLDASSDGCRVISSNLGSCDLTVLGAEGLSAFGLGLELTIDEPRSLVTNLVPTRYDLASSSWVAIGARPADLIAVPPALSTAPVNTGGLSGDQCDLSERGSVYVSFPTCNLVAEIDVLTGHVLQSRQFVSNAEGEIDVVDTGVSPVCPVECPAQFDGELPVDLPEIDQDGPFPQALELLQPPSNPVDVADNALNNRALFVGGLGSDRVFELRLTENGEWTEDVQSLELQGASGVSRIRISPPVDFQDTDFAELEFPDGVDDRQFLYVIVGDGSTRVISRELDISAGEPLGIECDTQRDPVAIEGAAEWACFPVSDADNIERRALVGGPGIRASGGADVTDWTFVKVYDFSELTGFNRSRYTLFDQPGVFAVGTTTRGELVYAMIDQSRANGQTAVAEFTACMTKRQTDAETCEEDVVLDPTGLLRVELAPHSLWPDPNVDRKLALPLLRDQAPVRAFEEPFGISRRLAPSLRLIDAAYSTDARRAAQLGNMGNYDKLGGNEDDEDVLYEESAPRIAVHDYRAWVQSDWSLAWEGRVVELQSSGRIACDNPGWEGGTCLVDEPDDARLHDSAAKFCDAGVLAGDKLVLDGCAEDVECGEGRRCLRETAGGGDSSGICVSAIAYEESAADLRVICEDFIHDPCGEARREYTITKAFQDELWIQSMDLPVISTIETNGMHTEGSEDLVPPDAPIVEVEDQWVCAEGTPDGGCIDDEECVDLDHDGEITTDEAENSGEWLCIEERCRRPCEDPSECMLRPLPGPACFAEFVRYEVTLRNAFLVGVTNVSSTLDPVEVDPDTGECVRSTSVENSTLLTSRLPLPASSSADDPDWNAIPLCPTDAVLPTDPNPCRIDSTQVATRFHLLPYQGQNVDALRFSNPLFSLVVDLTSLETLTSDVETFTASSWPVSFVPFRRSRISRGYEQVFRLAPQTGYQPFSKLVILESRPVTLPMRIVPSPEASVVFIVDGAGPGTSSGIRGQVVRATLSDGDVSVDSTFNGVR
jgi:hypothetical protein